MPDKQTTGTNPVYENSAKVVGHKKYEIPTFLSLPYPHKQIVPELEEYLNKRVIDDYNIEYIEGRYSAAIPGRSRNKSRPRIWSRLELTCSSSLVVYMKLHIFDFSSKDSWMDFLNEERDNQDDDR